MVELKEAAVVACVGWSAILAATVPTIAKSMIEAQKWKNNESLGIISAGFWIAFVQIAAAFGYWIFLKIINDSSMFTIWSDTASATDFYKFWTWDYPSMINDAQRNDNQSLAALLSVIQWSKFIFYSINAMIRPVLYFLAIMIGYVKVKKEIPYGESNFPLIIRSLLIALIICTICVQSYNGLASIILFLPNNMDLNQLSQCWWQTAVGAQATCQGM